MSESYPPLFVTKTARNKLKTVYYPNLPKKASEKAKNSFKTLKALQTQTTIRLKEFEKDTENLA